ncbi:hypothetical protein GUJ93_ZPchr0004g39150 [Zizania palustris]|uniref:Uncharacterized protein n=1 Tax=Zizania palustris TaxID=103762 RepID=A0A8J5SJN5_ZIZPA|nr:hypothetical protein GUJ93_ZPchr0004g39150 [Zizania palustris]
MIWALDFRHHIGYGCGVPPGLQNLGEAVKGFSLPPSGSDFRGWLTASAARIPRRRAAGAWSRGRARRSL